MKNELISPSTHTDKRSSLLRYQRNCLLVELEEREVHVHDLGREAGLCPLVWLSAQRVFHW